MPTSKHKSAAPGIAVEGKRKNRLNESKSYPQNPRRFFRLLGTDSPATQKMPDSKDQAFAIQQNGHFLGRAPLF